ncbi:MAG: hydroxymethylpyrimidine/phosphomethylpyrimidine kinase [Candidatus Thiodiazotropha sp.]
MHDETSTLPLLLAIGGHDPSGGAGIQADIEAAAANGAHAASAVTCLTVQDSCDVRALHPVAPEVLAAQAEAVLADCRVGAVKIGLLGSPQAAETVIDLLRRHPGLPVVLDPVLAAGGGSPLAGEDLLRLIRDGLLPLCDLVTPNTREAARLSECDAAATPDDQAARLLALGAGAVLITGTHDPAQQAEITHRLYRPTEAPIVSTCQRLAGEYHGSGCTLAAAIAARLARGESLETAVQHGLSYSWLSLVHGFRAGRCQAFPDRLFRLSRGSLDDDE